MIMILITILIPDQQLKSEYHHNLELLEMIAEVALKGNYVESTSIYQVDEVDIDD